LTRVVGNGIAWLKPYERVHMVVYLPVRVEPIAAEDLITLDKMIIPRFELLVFHRADPGRGNVKSGQFAFDPELILEKIWSPKAGDWRDTVKAISEAVLRDVVAQFKAEELYPLFGGKRAELIKKLTDVTNIRTKNLLGVEVIGVNIGEIRISDEAKSILESSFIANENLVEHIEKDMAGDSVATSRYAEALDRSSRLDTPVRDVADLDKYDVFLCYNAQDKPAIRKIDEALRSRGITPFLDERDMQPFVPFLDQIEDVVLKVNCVTVFVGPSGVGPWQDLEIKAILGERARRKIRTGLVPIRITGDIIGA